MKFLNMFVLLGALAVPGWAEDSGDAPDHGVARISALGGDVSVRRGDTGEFVAAELNAPLVALDHVLTEENSRAEIQLDWANFVRLASVSEVRLAELGDREFLIQVSAGAVTFRVLRDSQSQVEISTPTLAFRPRQQGTYRVTVREDFSTELTVRSGDAEIFVGGRSDFVHAGQTLFVSGDPADPQRAYRAAIPRDDFDRWNETRDHDLERSDSYKYVSRDIYGAEDLAGYGRWVYDAPYGWVWTPAVATSWAPYRVGRWTWVNYYGWTWVSGDPWGWAPYHYGRWYHTPRYGWVWHPGEIHERYYWRPALVGFFGWGVNVGWVALAPREVYRPWYGPGRSVVTNTTYVNNIDVVQNYRNARFISGRSGVTSIVAGNFARKVTINNYVVARDSDLKRAGHADRWLPHEPSREHRQFSERTAPHVNTRPDVDRRFVSSRPEWNGRDRQDNARRVDAASSRIDRNDFGRSRQPEGNRGRNENPASPVVGNRPDNVRRDESPRRNETPAFPVNASVRGRQPEDNRGRNENPASPVVGNRPDNVRRDESPRRNEPPTFPRSASVRSRQPEVNRGRNENPTPPVVGNRPDNVRRDESPRRNEPMTFPRNDSDRGRQDAGNRARGNSGNSVASRPSEPERRPEAAQSRDRGTPTFPSRTEPERTRQAEINSGRAPAFARPEVEQPRPAPASGTFRRAEPASRPSIDPVPQHAPEPQERPGRFPGVEREQPRENSRPEPRNSDSPPSPGNSSEGSNSGGRGRGRDHR